MTVYVVTCGEYSDYRICGIYSTRQGADRHVECLSGYARCTIEEWSLDPSEVLEAPAGHKPYLVCIRRDGFVDSVFVHDDIEGDPERFVHGNMLMRTRVWAADEAHAVKIANERRAQVIAGGRWPS